MDIADALKTIYKNDYFPQVSQLADKDLEIYFPSIDLTIDTLKVVDDTFELTESISSGSDLLFGACEASQIKFTLADVSQDLTDLEFVINQKVNGLYTMPLGIFKVKSCKKQDDAWFKDIVACDRMKKIDVDVSSWYNSLIFPMELSSFRSSLLVFLGLEEELRTLPNDDMNVTKTLEPSQISGRVVLEAIEEINGAFGHINRLGKFAHIVLQPAYGLYPSITLFPSSTLYPVSESDTTYTQDDLISETVSKAMYRSVKFEEYTVKEIDKLQIRSEEGDIGSIVGTGTNAYVIEGNFLAFGKGAEELEVIATNAFSNMNKRPLRPFKSDNIGLPYVEVGDTIEFATDDIVTSYVFKRTLTGIQALRDSFEAEGSEKRVQNFGINKQIIQLQGKSAVTKRTVEELTGTVTDLDEKLSGEISVMAGKVVLKVDTNGNVGYVTLNGDPDTDMTSIVLKADNISLEGIVTANSRFKILEDGSMEAVNGKFSGSITGGSMNINDRFTVDTNGNLVANGANIVNGTFTGTLTAPLINGGDINSATIISSSQYGVMEISGSYIIGTNSSGVIKLNIDYNGNVDCNNLACQTLNGYTPITSDNIGSQDVYGLRNTVYVSAYSNFRPVYDGIPSCGTSDGRWSSIWSVDGAIHTSDLRKKDDVKPLDERFVRFAKMIVPYMFQMKEGTSGRYHTGFIAQYIEQAMIQCGISDMEFAGLVKAPVYRQRHENGDYDVDSNIIDYDYFLRYDEFIPLLFLLIN